MALALDRTEIGVTSAPSSAPSPTPMATSLGRFALLRELGAGAMGVVYAAYDEELDRRLAIKLLHTGPGDTEGRARSLREAQAMARVSHPNVVQIYEVGILADQVFVAMEFIDGPTLGAWQRAESRSPAEILRLYIQAGRGLSAAHAAGLVHRDFKPENVLVGKDDRVRVGDFGLARAFDHPVVTTPREPATSTSSPAITSFDPPMPASLAAAALGLAETATPASASISGGANTMARSSNNLLASPMTVVGAVVGTPAYMSPEQHSGAALDARSDQFSFCAALYGALYGLRPFAGETLPALVHNVLTGALRPPPADPAVPPWVFPLLQRGLATDPAARWPDMDALLRALDRDPQRDPSSGGRERRGFAVLMALTVLLTTTMIVGGAMRGEVHPIQPFELVLTGGVAGASILIGVLAFGRTLLRDHFHREVLIVAGVAALNMISVRLILALAGVESLVIVRTDLACAALLCLLGGLLVVRWYWIVGAVPTLGVLLSYVVPERIDLVAQLLYTALVVVFLLCWNHTSPRPR
jgi:serine/threonine-protein kinase